MSPIASGVNTIIACLAEAAAEFQRNWPELSSRIRGIYVATYPGCM